MKRALISGAEALAQWSPLRKKPRPEPILHDQGRPGDFLGEQLPRGLSITDLKGNHWIIGHPIGAGGFGQIYSACPSSQSPDAFPPWQKNVVVKVEPHQNGPLFVEMHFYLCAAKREHLQQYKERRKLSHLGIPELLGCGSFTHLGKKWRFLVTPWLGIDMDQMTKEVGKDAILPVPFICSVAAQVIQSYEYLHEKGYVHKDVKGSNLLVLGSRVFLVDFGLASKLSRSGAPRLNLPKTSLAHEGTLLYCSRDAHRGCVSRRGDFEVLLYNMVEWLGGKLPWDQEPCLTPDQVHHMKQEAFNNVDSFLADSLRQSSANNDDLQDFLIRLMNKVKLMPFYGVPDYEGFLAMLDAVGQKPLSQPRLLRSRSKIHNRSSTNSLVDMTVTAVGKKRHSGRRQRVPKDEDGRLNRLYLRQISAHSKRLAQQSWTNPTPAMLLVAHQCRTKLVNRDFESVAGKRRPRRSKASKPDLSTTVKAAELHHGTSAESGHMTRGLSYVSALITKFIFSQQPAD